MDANFNFVVRLWSAIAIVLITQIDILVVEELLISVSDSVEWCIGLRSTIRLIGSIGVNFDNVGGLA